MGAVDFIKQGQGKTAREAFDAVVSQARFEDGNGGYTGTIAEKNSFFTVSVPEGMTPDEYLYSLQFGDDAPERLPNGKNNPFFDKWGPAGCLDLGDGSFIFFGSASS